jgi:FimV-like protein
VTSPSDTGDINTWREWVLNGRAADARRAMRAHLARHPSDAATWSLLADCERKAKRWPSAIAAYEKARVHGSDKQASHATYMMATVYQKNLRDHGRAVAMFRAYKASGYVSKELKDLTDVHLARSLIALGKRDEARALLEAVIARQGDSFVGQNAKRLLEKCEAYRP